MQHLIGQTFSQWRVIDYLGTYNRVNKFSVKCSCGNESISDYIALTRGKSTRCKSCAKKPPAAGNKTRAHTHGYSSLTHPYFRIYTIWGGIKSRCTRATDKTYPWYGGRGITMCERWFNSFECFLEDMGHCEPHMSIDRIDVNGNYCPENCRWVDRETQANNTRLNVYYEYGSEKLSESQWGRKLGIGRFKVSNWARKYGISWLVENVDKVKLTRKRMPDCEYIALGLPLPAKRWRPKK